MWLRPRVPLVAGETPTPPLECLVTAADSASGVAVVVDPARATFVNGDLTIALHRAPVGEWTCLDAAATGERARHRPGAGATLGHDRPGGTLAPDLAARAARG